GAPERGIGVAKPSPDPGRKAPHHDGGQLSPSRAALAQSLEGSGPLANLELGQVDALPEAGIVQFGDTGLDRIVEAFEPGLSLGDRDALAVDFRFKLPARVVGTVGHRLKNRNEALGSEDLLLDGLDHHLVDLVHADRMTAAGALGGALGAGQVLVASTLSG